MKEKEITLNNLATKVDDLAITINDLASATVTGFVDSQKRFESIDKRFEKIDQRFDHLDNETKLIRIEISNGLREIKDEIKRLDERIDGVLKMANEDIAVVIRKVEIVELELTKLKQKIAKLKMANS